MSEYKQAVGIDLGTTHCAMARIHCTEDGAASEVVEIEQLVAPKTVERRSLLGSFCYCPPESEGAQALPWDRDREFALGHYARTRAVEAPGRVISSAKSWLCHPSLDRRSGVLPLGAPEDVEKISAVEVSWRYLEHLIEVFDKQYAEDPRCGPLYEQDIILTVPASFDAAARELTVEAAAAAGIEELTLIEEPQAALYAWIEAQGESWRKQLEPGDVILVIDIGGGTSDFSAIAATDEDGSLELKRIAVGDHILLGGDNMDLAMAYQAKGALEGKGGELDAWQMTALTHACRGAKEKLLADDSLASVPVTIAGRGSKLVGKSLRTEIERSAVEKLVLEGFFPEVDADARPAARARTALTTVGLPYASDPAITKHLAAFLSKQRAALKGKGKLLHPTAVLFNGGVLHSTTVRDRLIGTVNRWLEADGAPPVKVLGGVEYDLAVARGAAYFGRTRAGRGIRIRGGTARAYYVGIESAVPAVPGIEPPITAMCVAPFGMEEGTEADLPPQELAVVVGEPVRFRFFSSSVRRDDKPGALIERAADAADTEIEELAPIEVTLPAEGRREGDLVPVRLSASVTPVGTLLLEAVPLQARVADERWKVELNVRGGAEGDE
ncbi:MAG: Hsp70 family protein [Deltaproteobacteria bacterium]|nr:Hsp70 family protein [Deltaproteobacteria bacterium]MBW2534521.1 Hsp70 family protein [Deltaproteobacteria bacterium]